MAFTVSVPVCPECRSRLRGGWPKFGPAQVLCGYCGKNVNTSLSGWDEGPFPSKSRKIAIVMTELFAPTCMGYQEAFPRFLINLLPLVLTCGLPAIPLIRLMKMIQESKSFDASKQPPVWKWLFHQKR